MESGPEEDHNSSKNKVSVAANTERLSQQRSDSCLTCFLNSLSLSLRRSLLNLHTAAHRAAGARVINHNSF